MYWRRPVDDSVLYTADNLLHAAAAAAASLWLHLDAGPSDTSCCKHLGGRDMGGKVAAAEVRCCTNILTGQAPVTLSAARLPL